jgi:branched-chain amino acid transport system ATP-binding protein
LLKIENLNVFYGQAQVLFDVSFTVNKGEIFSLVGSNGSGKTSLINTITGVIKPKSGSIFFDGQDITKLPSNKIVADGIVQVPEGRRLFPELTVRQNLELGAYPKNARKYMKDTIEFVFTLMPKLKILEKHLAGNLSGGEQQMCAIGRALMAKPRLLCLDEPSLGLAPIIVRDVFKLIKDISSIGTTIMLVEQNVQHALEMADQGIVFENGHIVIQGKGGDILADDNLRAAFLGL